MEFGRLDSNLRGAEEALARETTYRQIRGRGRLSDGSPVQLSVQRTAAV